ncbi:MAG: septum formation initiator [Rikenellaceae bacterium]
MAEHRSAFRRVFSLDYIRENKLTLLSIVVVVWMLYMIGVNLIHAIQIRFAMVGLHSDQKIYQKMITKDSAIIESLKYDDELERYAREKFFMQRAGEEIFIIEGAE